MSSWSGSKLFAKIISRRQKSPLARQSGLQQMTIYNILFISWYAGEFCMLSLGLLIFFLSKLTFFKKNFRNTISRQTVLTQIRHNILQGLIWVTVCKKSPKHFYPLELKMAKNFTELKEESPNLCDFQRYFLQDLALSKGLPQRKSPMPHKTLSTLQSQAGWSGSSAAWKQTQWLPKRTPKLPFIIHCTYS